MNLSKIFQTVPKSWSDAFPWNPWDSIVEINPNWHDRTWGRACRSDWSQPRTPQSSVILAWCVDFASRAPASKKGVYFSAHTSLPATIQTPAILGTVSALYFFCSHPVLRLPCVGIDHARTSLSVRDSRAIGWSLSCSYKRITVVWTVTEGCVVCSPRHTRNYAIPVTATILTDVLQWTHTVRIRHI